MRTTLWLGVLLSSSSLLAACGDNKDPTEADARIVSDAPPGSIDAPDDDPDAGPPADAAPGFECNGVPIPTTAPDEITVNGAVVAVGVSGNTPVVGATVDAFVTGVTDPVATTTTGAGGAYTLDLANPPEVPADGYLRATAAGHKTVFLYPPTLLYQDITAPILTIPNALFGTFIGLAQANVQAGNGVIALSVRNCANEPIEGAVVTTPAAGAQIRYNDGATGFPSGTATETAADGIAYIIDVDTGAVEVDATFNGIDFREHSVIVHSAGSVKSGEENAMTLTTIIP
jgi:hypothetical protein